jgi:5-methylcytosine-specific restriction protein A
MTRPARSHTLAERVGFNRPCLGCGRPIRGASRCPTCQGRAYGGSSLTPTGSTRRWRRTRQRHLVIEPLCRDCLAEGRVTPATDVDHILLRVAGGTDDDANLRSLCRDHHQRRERLVEHHPGRGQRVFFRETISGHCPSQSSRENSSTAGGIA